MVFIEHPAPYDRVLDTLHGRIQDIFNEHGVQIMTPTFEMQPRQKRVVPPERRFTSPAEGKAYSERVRKQGR